MYKFNFELEINDFTVFAITNVGAVSVVILFNYSLFEKAGSKLSLFNGNVNKSGV